MHSTFRPAVILGSALLLATACENPGSKEQAIERSAAGPAEAQEPATAPGMPPIGPSDVATLEGRVEDVQPAGHYTYLRIATEGERGNSRESWAVVLGKAKAQVGDALTLKVHGSKTNFHSRRLGRDFDEVFFARIVAGA